MKKCPFCAEEIQDEAIKCRFCGSLLNEPQPRFQDGASLEVDREIRHLLQNGKKIEAIKLVREQRGLDLKAAKDYVEGLESGGAVVVPVRDKFSPPSPEIRKSSSSLTTVLVVLIALGAMGWAGGLFSTTSPKPVVTMSEFNRIENGLSYADVVQIIGASGQEMSRSDVAGITTVMYSWSNSNGSNMNAMFQDGKLISKAQFGLP